MMNLILSAAVRGRKKAEQNAQLEREKFNRLNHISEWDDIANIVLDNPNWGHGYCAPQQWVDVAAWRRR